MLYRQLLRISLGYLLSATLFWAPSVNAAQEASAASPFLAEQTVMQQLPQLEQQATAQQKLLLVVLGASWCHVSMALVKQFHQQPLQQQLAQRFVIAYADVGYLEAGRDISQRYGLPLYYATPSVLIINPETRQLLNKADLMHWSNAASLKTAEYRQYFINSDFTLHSGQPALAALSATHQQQINAFEQQQAQQLWAGYQHLGPLLKAYKQDDPAAKTAFLPVWNEVKALRISIIPQIDTLIQQAGTLQPQQPLQLPATAVFSFQP